MHHRSFHRVVASDLGTRGYAEGTSSIALAVEARRRRAGAAPSNARGECRTSTAAARRSGFQSAGSTTDVVKAINWRRAGTRASLTTPVLRAGDRCRAPAVWQLQFGEGKAWHCRPAQVPACVFCSSEKKGALGQSSPANGSGFRRIRRSSRDSGRSAYFFWRMHKASGHSIFS